MSTTTAEADQCRALIDDGERCSRPAQDDGFCYQHDGSDPTVDDAGADDTEQAQDDGSAEEMDGESAAGSAVETDGSVDRETDADESEQSGDETESDESASGSSSGLQGSRLQEARNTAIVVARDLIGGEPDGIIGITQTDDGWQVTIEVVERTAVPDTQDIIGRYEIEMDSEHDPAGYRRLERYRRGDTKRDDPLE